MTGQWRREFLSKDVWHNDHGWPVQVITRVEHMGVDYILYLRLRGQFWEGYVIRGARCIQDMSRKVVCWSCDELEYHWLKFYEYQLTDAQQALIGIFQHRYGGLGTELVFKQPRYSMKLGGLV